MPEREFAVQHYGVEYICDECGEHPMQANGLMLPSDPPKFRNDCPCGAFKMLGERYPTVRFRRIETEHGG